MKRLNDSQVAYQLNWLSFSLATFCRQIVITRLPEVVGPLLKCVRLKRKVFGSLRQLNVVAHTARFRENLKNENNFRGFADCIIECAIRGNRSVSARRSRSSQRRISICRLHSLTWHTKRALLWRDDYRQPTRNKAFCLSFSLLMWIYDFLRSSPVPNAS